MADVAVAAGVAATFSGVPSTVHAVLAGRPVLAASRAAGGLMGRPTLLRGTLSHIGLSLGWAAVLARLLPGRRAALWGAAGGGAMALLDLSIARRWFPAIAALPTAPQVADHIVFGALVGLVLDVSRHRG